MGDEVAKASQHDADQNKLKKEGFTSVDEMVLHNQSVSAERDQAVTARDKFHADNDEARKIIGSKAGEIGTLKQENETLMKEIETLKGAPPPEPKPNDPPKPPVKPVEEELSAVEDSLTEDHKAVFQALYEAEADDDKALKMIEDKTYRLNLLKRIKSDPEFKSRPKSAFADKGAVTPPTVVDDPYDVLKKKLGRTPLGPSGGGAPRGGQHATATARGTHPSLR